MDKPTITLARNKCYVDGQWVGEPKLPVTNKATGDIMARVPELGEAETRAAIDAANRALPGWSKLIAKERARLVRRWYDLIVEHADELALILTAEQGKPLAEARGEIALCRGLRRIRRRGGQAHLRRDHPDLQGRCAHHRHQAAGRRRCRHHAVELSRRHDHPQGRPGAGGRLHHGAQARLGDAAVRRWRWRCWPSGPASPRACSMSSPATRRVIGDELTGNPIVRMLTFTGSTEVGTNADARSAPDRQEARPRARRQCAVHRLRRRRSRRGGRRRHGLQVSQCRPDLRMRQPHLRAGGRL